MTLDKAIEHKKEKRKPYRKSKAIDSTCKNHGSCPWCTRNRTFDKNPTLEDLLKDITPENIHGETDWGSDVGKEVIDND